MQGGPTPAQHWGPLQPSDQLATAGASHCPRLRDPNEPAFVCRLAGGRALIVPDMPRSTRLDWTARAAVTVGALLPYLPLLSLNRLYVTDDGFTSDIFNGELPLRVLTGRMLADGQAPVWTSDLCSGLPMAAGNALDPVSLLLFASQPIARALCLYVIFLLLVAAHGAFGLARRVGADRWGATLAGVAFAGSGYVVTQLKHLAIVSTVVWLPWGLLLLDRALSNRSVDQVSQSRLDETATDIAERPSLPLRLRDLVLFGLVYAAQVLAGFPQSVYISSIVYGLWSLALLYRLRERWRGIPIALLLAISTLGIVGLGAACGAPSILPLLELAGYSDRRAGLSFQFASMLPYSWRDLLNFLSPYANGDIADLTYTEKGLFWENYGYVGAGTLGLAVWASLRGWRRPRVLLMLGVTLGALSMVLGRHTPAFYLAWKYLPGMQSFRFPTRFLVVVDLMIAVLAALGLKVARSDLQRLLRRISPHVTKLLAPVLVIGTALDLAAHQTHQNPYVPAGEWLAPPAAVTKLGDPNAEAGSPSLSRHARLYSPLHSYLHRIAYQKARGWADLTPYRELREGVAPNTGVYWRTATADCYAAISPQWYVDTWGDHSRGGLLIPSLIYWAHDSIVLHNGLPSLLASYGVTHLVSPLAIHGPGLRELENEGRAHLYAIGGQRARIVPQARVVRSSVEAAGRMTQPGFDPAREVLIHDVDTDSAEFLPRVNTSQSGGTAVVTEERSTRLRLSVNSPDGGYLVLNDTYYPGWHARVDDQAVRIYRANISVRAIRLTPGAHNVEFSYQPLAFYRGLAAACVALCCLLGLLGLLQYRCLKPKDARL